ncbi:uncharacterized protein B0H18DRAFT_1119717 [Fomitopsis serialis]|uniref:uncharacterized protein n=1 Tax=Fomitopsis serialis TaxID=139415 RepID=UPI0020072BF9|nr:uncharacterized protein B0H18DRAFT_1119717 [Neoantrodia serialis]KAH9924929.1 hypothetical protein B0H18DRAFT_1119717 [Neoantrodia serialis]
MSKVPAKPLSRKEQMEGNLDLWFDQANSVDRGPPTRPKMWWRRSENCCSDMVLSSAFRRGGRSSLCGQGEIVQQSTLAWVKREWPELLHGGYSRWPGSRLWKDVNHDVDDPMAGDQLDNEDNDEGQSGSEDDGVPGNGGEDEDEAEQDELEQDDDENVGEDEVQSPPRKSEQAKTKRASILAESAKEGNKTKAEQYRKQLKKCDYCRTATRAVRPCVLEKGAVACGTCKTAGKGCYYNGYSLTGTQSKKATTPQPAVNVPAASRTKGKRKAPEEVQVVPASRATRRTSTAAAKAKPVHRARRSQSTATVVDVDEEDTASTTVVSTKETRSLRPKRELTDSVGDAPRRKRAKPDDKPAPTGEGKRLRSSTLASTRSSSQTVVTPSSDVETGGPVRHGSPGSETQVSGFGALNVDEDVQSDGGSDSGLVGSLSGEPPDIASLEYVVRHIERERDTLSGQVIALQATHALLTQNLQEAKKRLRDLRNAAQETQPGPSRLAAVADQPAPSRPSTSTIPSGDGLIDVLEWWFLTGTKGDLKGFTKAKSLLQALHRNLTAYGVASGIYDGKKSEPTWMCANNKGNTDVAHALKEINVPQTTMRRQDLRQCDYCRSAKRTVRDCVIEKGSFTCGTCKRAGKGCYFNGLSLTGSKKRKASSPSDASDNRTGTVMPTVERQERLMLRIPPSMGKQQGAQWVARSTHDITDDESDKDDTPGQRRLSFKSPEALPEKHRLPTSTTGAPRRKRAKMEEGPKGTKGGILRSSKVASMVASDIGAAPSEARDTRSNRHVTFACDTHGWHDTDLSSEEVPMSNSGSDTSLTGLDTDETHEGLSIEALEALIQFLTRQRSTVDTQIKTLQHQHRRLGVDLDLHRKQLRVARRVQEAGPEPRRSAT